MIAPRELPAKQVDHRLDAAVPWRRDGDPRRCQAQLSPAVLVTRVVPIQASPAHAPCSTSTFGDPGLQDLRDTQACMQVFPPGRHVQ